MGRNIFITCLPLSEAKGMEEDMTRIETDVAIIAAGPAGLCAAVAAAEKGAEVAVFEKSNTFGGTANMGMGPFGVESKLQRRTMIDLSKEELFRRFMDYVHWQADANLVHDYLWKSGDTIDWLEDMGVRFAGAIKNFPDSEPTWHVVIPEGGGRPGARSATAMNKVIYERAMELGVQFYFNTPAYELIKDGDEVIGLKARGEDGEEYEVDAGAVIIATGGFGTNPEMVKEYTGYTLEQDMFDFMVPGIMGDGIRMAWEAGAARGRMEMERVLGYSLPGSSAGQYVQGRAFGQGATLAVNIQGYRVCDETVMQNTSVGGNIIDFQSNKSLYVIIADSVLERFRKNGIDYPSEVFHDDPLEDFEAVWEKAAVDYPDCAWVADTVEELADKIGIPTKQLVKTVERYNKMCKENYDDDFGKKRRYLEALEGKFYAYRLVCSAYGSLGGIKIDHHFRALNNDCEPIVGLYAAGSDVCDIYNGTYYYYLPGNTMGFAVNSGRMAGEYAADLALGYEEE